MSGRNTFRGRPLVALLAVLGGWAGGRAATWDMPVTSTLHAPATAEAAVPSQSFVADPSQGPLSYPGMGYAYQPLPPAPRTVAIPYPMAFAGMPRFRPGAMPWSAMPGAMPPYYAGLQAQPYPAPDHLGDGFALSEPLPRFYAPEPPGMTPASSAPAAPSVPAKARRWSVDAWALLRRDSDGGVASPGALPATYGASQAGAVLRYRLALNHPYRPTLYMRTTSSMGKLPETSAALGLSARPLPSLPVIAAVEGRLTTQGGKSRFQPAAMAVTELPPFPLPAGFRGEAYGQAGYVAGSFATPFADGQFRADRALLSVGRVDTRVGAGLWGGVQKGAARLDAGPTASIAMPLGRGTFGRVAVDWRFRVAGEAVPDSGPALTLSAGF